jgi:hypothetical protein
MANHRFSVRSARRIGSASLAIALLQGCAGNSMVADADDAAAPTQASPQPIDPTWTRPGRSASELPDPIRIVDGKAERWQTVEPVIIDTRDFPNQLQFTAPWDGPVGTNKDHLPAHGRDKSLRTFDVPAMPEGVTGGDPRVTGTGIGFEAIPQTPWSPPDPTLAVGPNHIVETVNQSIAFYTKDGTQQFSAPLGSPGSPGFFEGEGAGNFTFDPTCFYDQKTGRFVVTVLEFYSPTEAWIDIAVSDDSDPNGVWYKYRTWSVIEINGSNYWVDYPGFGFDDHAFYVTNNLFLLNGNGPGFGGVAVRVFDKAPLLNGEPAVFTDLVASAGSMQVAQMNGDAPIPYFVTRSGSNALRIWTVLDALTAPALGFVDVTGLASASSPSNDAPNLGGGELDTLDGRIMNVHWRDGNLYTTHAINAPDGTTRARWYHIATNNWPFGSDPQLIQQGNIDLPGVHYFFPAIASDKFGRVGMVMARSAANERASVYIAGREPTDPFGQMSEPVQLAIGNAGTSGRWGDYFDIAIDPNDDRTFWVVGQYARDFGWQSWIGSFLAGCPGDEDGNGQVNFFDIADFIGRFSAGDPSVDIALPFGTIDFFDIVVFINRFNQGCP